MAVGVAFGLAFAGPVASASAGTLTPDTLLFSANLSNSGNAELPALANHLGVDVSSLTQDYKSPGDPVPTRDDGNWYFDVGPSAPGYFLIKIGNGSIPFDSHYFFKNVGELDKLVFSIAEIPGLYETRECNNCGIERLSHYAFYSSVATVPVPAALPLAAGGLAFLGLIGLRRRHLGSASA